MEHFLIGDRVKYSDYALRPHKDHYLSWGGSARDRAKRVHDDMAAKRGTVTALCQGGIVVRLDGNNAKHHSVDYIWTPA